MNFTLRKWNAGDIPELAKIATNPKISANLRNTFPCPYSLQDAEWFVNDCIAKKDSHQIARAIVVNEKPIGGIGIFVKDDVYEKSAELGYWLSEDYWRRGITSQAVKLICKEAFDSLDIIRIYAEPFDYNIGSKRVLEKAGFSYEGTMRNGVYKNDKVHSYCMYSLLKEEMNL